MIELRSDLATARINDLNSQLFSLDCDGAEFMWAGGGPEELKTPEERRGWQNSEIVMFPVIGKPARGSISVGGTRYPMTQHGIARYVRNNVVARSKVEARFEQAYVGGTVVEGPRGPSSFPFSYRLTKTFSLQGRALAVLLVVENTSEQAFPYAIGWHPALRVSREDSSVQTASRSYSIAEIRGESARGALVLEGQEDVEYVSGERRVGLRSDFGHIQLWSPDGGSYLCIEPISAISLSDDDQDCELLAREGYAELAPGESRRHSTTMTFHST